MLWFCLLVCCSVVVCDYSFLVVMLVVCWRCCWLVVMFVVGLIVVLACGLRCLVLPGGFQCGVGFSNLLRGCAG